MQSSPEPDPPSSGLSMRQLAALAGFSRTTVSQALRNHPGISEATRKTIVELAEKHGYRPDPLVSTLMNQLRVGRPRRQAEKLAYLTWWETADGWRRSRNDLLWFEGACERGRALGYEVEHFWAKQPGLTAARLSKILYTRGIRGLIIAPPIRLHGHLSLHWQYFTAATISFSAVKPGLNRTSHFHYSGMLLALRQLKSLGYRRIGFTVLEDHVERVNHGWLNAYMIFQDQHAPEFRVPPLLHKTWDRDAIGSWMKAHQIEAVISNMPEPLYFLRELGYRVPEDVGFASLDRLHLDDPWAGIDQSPKMVAASAVDLVTSQLQRNEFGLPSHPQTVMLDGLWHDGPTVQRRRR